MLAPLLSQEPSGGKLQHVRVAAGAVVGRHEVVANHKGEGERAAGLGLVLVAADRAEQQAQVVHARRPVR